MARHALIISPDLLFYKTDIAIRNAGGHADPLLPQTPRF